MKMKNNRRHNNPTGMRTTRAGSNSEMRQVEFVRKILYADRWGMAACALLAGVLIESGARAGVYYVDVENGSDSNSGTSQGTAWAHLPGSVGFAGTGWVALQSGDSVYVKGGTTNFVQVKFTASYYSGDKGFDSVQVMSGHLANPSWGSGRAIFDETNTNTFGFWIAAGNNCDGLTVDGFEIRNIAAGGVGVTFDPARGSSCIVVGGNFRAEYTKIRRCYLHDARRDTDDEGHGIETEGSGGSEQMIIERNIIGPRIGSKGIECGKLNNGVISENYVENTGDHGIVVTGTHWDVCNNVVRMVPPYVHDPVYAMKLNRSYNDVWNNILYQQDTPVPTPGDQRASGFGIFPNSSFNRVYHNTIYNFANTVNGREYGAGIAIGAEGGLVGNNDIQNNIVYRCRNQNGGIQLFVYLAATNTTIRYNDLYYSSAADKVFSFGNAFYLAAEINRALTLNAGRMEANRQFPPNFKGEDLPDGLDVNFNPNTDYFTLTPQSDANLRYTLNALNPITSNGYSSAPEKFSTDIRGRSRVAWSMGAYEFVGRSPPPTNLRIIPGQ